MKSAILRITLALLFIVPTLFAGEFDRQLAELSAQRDKAIADASQPILVRYRTALEVLLKKAMQANDLDAAVKIKAAIGGGTAAVASVPAAASATATSSAPAAAGTAGALSRFVGQWHHANSRIEFLNTGSFRETVGIHVTDGHWLALSRTDAKVIRKTKAVIQFHISDDGNSITRSTDGYVWKREE